MPGISDFTVSMLLVPRAISVDYAQTLSGYSHVTCSTIRIQAFEGFDVIINTAPFALPRHLFTKIIPEGPIRCLDYINPEKSLARIIEDHDMKYLTKQSEYYI
jgi:hypothetical protein